LTDHHQNVGAEVLAVADALLNVGVMPIIGCEYSTAENHLLIYGVPVVPSMFGMYPRMQEVVDWVNSQGGACICAHPFKGYSRSIKEGVEGITGLAAVETLNGQVEERDPLTNGKAFASARKMGAAMTGASDAHVAEDIGSTFTRFQGHLSTVGEVIAMLRSGNGFEPMRNETVFAARRERKAAERAKWEQEDKARPYYASKYSISNDSQQDDLFLKSWSDSGEWT
jgi:predicted metal-dependent phosphoesterase TrpH